jgi:hypothetical protein
MRTAFIISLICTCASCEPSDEETFGPVNAFSKVDFARLGEDIEFAGENRSFDTATIYTLPEKLDYIAMSGLEKPAGENNIYPIGFSANWKHFAYIEQRISPNKNNVTTQLVILNANQPDDSTINVNLDSTYKLMEFQNVWLVSEARVTKELRKHSIIQSPTFSFGNVFTCGKGKIGLKCFDATMKHINEKGPGQHVANIIYAYNEKGDSTMFSRKPQLYDMTVYGYGPFGAFVGKRFMYVLTLLQFTDMLQQTQLIYNLEWCPLDIKKIPMPKMN